MLTPHNRMFLRHHHAHTHPSLVTTLTLPPLPVLPLLSLVTQRGSVGVRVPEPQRQLILMDPARQ